MRKSLILSHHMGISVCFSWALDTYIFNFRFCLTVVTELYLPDEQREKEKRWYEIIGYVL